MTTQAESGSAKARNPKARNAAGQRLGHTAAEIRQFRMSVDELRKAVELNTNLARQRDGQIVEALDRLTRSVNSLSAIQGAERNALVVFVGNAIKDQNEQFDEALRRVVDQVRQLCATVVDDPV